MTNADKFKGIFGIYATELWAKPEKEFLEWLNEDAPDTNVGDTISRKAAINALGKEPEVRSDNGQYDQYDLGLNNQWWDDVDAIKALPSAQTEQLDIRPNIVTTWRSDGLYSLICPVCGYRKVVWTNFCSNCGKDLRGGYN